MRKVTDFLELFRGVIFHSCESKDDKVCSSVLMHVKPKFGCCKLSTLQTRLTRFFFNSRRQLVKFCICQLAKFFLTDKQCITVLSFSQKSRGGAKAYRTNVIPSHACLRRFAAIYCGRWTKKCGWLWGLPALSGWNAKQVLQGRTTVQYRTKERVPVGTTTAATNKQIMRVFR
jgi:hypothetical protein